MQRPVTSVLHEEVRLARCACVRVVEVLHAVRLDDPRDVSQFLEKLILFVDLANKLDVLVSLATLNNYGLHCAVDEDLSEEHLAVATALDVLKYLECRFAHSSVICADLRIALLHLLV